MQAWSWGLHHQGEGKTNLHKKLRAKVDHALGRKREPSTKEQIDGPTSPQDQRILRDDHQIAAQLTPNDTINASLRKIIYYSIYHFSFLSCLLLLLLSLLLLLLHAVLLMLLDEDFIEHFLAVIAHHIDYLLFLKQVNVSHFLFFFLVLLLFFHGFYGSSEVLRCSLPIVSCLCLVKPSFSFCHAHFLFFL